MQFSYEINGKTYTQKKLVLGQIQQLLAALEGVRFIGTHPLEILFGLGARLQVAIAIVLVPEGTKVEKKDVKAVMSDIFNLDTDTAVQVVEDFFTCNPASALMERLTGLIKKTTDQVPPENG